MKTLPLLFIISLFSNDHLYELNTCSKMKTLCLLFIISSVIKGVFGDTGEVKTVTVMEADSVTLHTDLTEIQTDDLMVWRFEEFRIAQINKVANIISVYDTVLNGKFRDRLKLDDQTGDLTITNIRSEHTGHYQVDITVGSESKAKSFSVSALDSSSDGVKMVSVMKRDSVTLHTDITEIQRDDVIVWRFGPQHTIIAEINKPLGDRLYLNHQNGDLTIRHISNDAYGLYSLQITRSGKSFTIHKSFNVTESDTLNRIKVKEGDPVNLWSGVTEIQKVDVILWWFENGDSPLAKINRAAGIFSTHDDDRFRDRLKLDHQTGSLTITNITTEDSGLYHVDITSSTHTKFTRFTVTVCGAGVSSDVGYQIGLAAVAVVAVVVAVAIYYRHRLKPLVCRRSQRKDIVL